MKIIQSIFNFSRRLYVPNAFPLVIFGISRLGLFLISYLGLLLIPINITGGRWQAFPQNLFLDGWARWDSAWYANIARGGYRLEPNSFGQTNIPFFPLYPFLIRVTEPLFGDAFLAGFILSNIAFLLALIILFHLVKERFSLEVAHRCIVLLAVYPFSFFFSAVYTESLFLLALITAFYFGEQQKWGWAGLAAAIAGATRFVGFLAVPALIIMYLEQRNFNWREIRGDILLPLLGLGGLGSYMIFLAVRFGEPLLFYESQLGGAWEGSTDVIRPILATLRVSLSPSVLAAGDYPAMDVFQIGMLILSITLCLLAWQRLSRAYVVWSLLMIIVSATVWRSTGRLVMVIFPLFITAAILLNRQRLYQTVLYFSVLLLGLFTIAFAHFYWVG